MRVLVVLAVIFAAIVYFIAVARVAQGATWQERSLVYRINEARVAPLHPHKGLDRAATRYAKHLLGVLLTEQGSASIRHDPRLRPGVGEVLFWSYGPRRYARLGGIVRAWLSSPPHRAILLGDFTRIGCGVAFAPGHFCGVNGPVRVKVLVAVCRVL